MYETYGQTDRWTEGQTYRADGRSVGVITREQVIRYIKLYN